LEWAVLDKLAAQMHKQDATRQRARELELQQRLREDLGRQMADTKIKEDRVKQMDHDFLKAQTDANEKWQQDESAKEEKQKEKLRVQKEERQLQLVEVQERRDQEKTKLKQEDQEMMERIQTDMEVEKKRVEDRWAAKRDQQKKALALSNESIHIKNSAQKEQEEQEKKAYHEYHRAQELREREKQEKKDAEEAQRIKRESVGAARAEIEKHKEQQAHAKSAKERQAKDASDVQREETNQKMLADQRLHTQAYLLQQMRDKQTIKQVEVEKMRKIRQDAESDSKIFHKSEITRGNEKRGRNMEHRAQLERQIEKKMATQGPAKNSEVMSEVELRLNRNLLERVNQALSEITEV